MDAWINGESAAGKELSGSTSNKPIPCNGASGPVHVLFKDLFIGDTRCVFYFAQDGLPTAAATFPFA
jgi:hypothetical protein